MKSISQIAKETYDNYASFAEVIEPNTAADFAEEVFTEYNKQFKDESIAHKFFLNYSQKQNGIHNAKGILEWYIYTVLQGLETPIQCQEVKKPYSQFNEGDYQFIVTNDDTCTYLIARLKVPFSIYAETAGKRFNIEHLHEVVIREGHTNSCINIYLKEMKIIDLTITI